MGQINLKDTLTHKEFIISFCGTFIAALGLPSAILTIVGKHLSLSLTSFLVLFALLVSIVINKHQLRKTHLPDIDIVPLKQEGKESFTLHCPCNSELSKAANHLAQHFYGANTISPSRYESLLEKNPFILVCLTGAQGKVLGYFDVI